MNVPDIPLRFDMAQPATVQRDLSRLAVGLVAYFKNLPPTTDSRPLIGGVKAGRAVLAFGQITRVSPKEDEAVILTLRRPAEADGGRTIGVVRLTAVGSVELVCADCTVNGYERIYLLGHIGITTITTDGANYYMDNVGALNWTAGL